MALGLSLLATLDLSELDLLGGVAFIFLVTVNMMAFVVSIWGCDSCVARVMGNW
jgi:hypothetical protein